MKSIIAVLLAGVLFFGFIFWKSETFMPDSNFYNFKRIFEKGKMATLRTPEAKTEYSMYLINERFEEIEHVIEKKEYDLVLSTSLRYSTTAGETVEIVRAHNLTAFRKPIEQTFATHKKKFAHYEDTVIVEGGHLGFLRDAINYLDLYSENLKSVQ